MSSLAPAQVKLTSTPVQPGASAILRRKCACEENPEQDDEQRGMIQRKGSGLGSSASAPALVQEVLNSPGAPLDESARAFMEARFGHDFSQVRVHTDERAAESAREVDALAYTVGRDIVFAAGQYQPASFDGR